MASVAALLAALGLQQTPAGVTHMALQWVWPKLWLDPQQTSGEVAPLVMVASVTASLAAQDPQQTPCWAALMRLAIPAAASLAALDLQLTPDGAALVALLVGKHRQAPCWATLVTSVLLGY